MTVIVLPDTEGGVKDALLADTAVAAIVGTHVSFGFRADVTGPQVVVARVGGGDDPGEAPIDLALIQLDCYGAERNKAQATALANAVRSWAQSVRRATALNEEVTAYSAVVQSCIWAPDDSDRPKYAITALVMARAADAEQEE